MAAFDPIKSVLERNPDLAEDICEMLNKISALPRNRPNGEVKRSTLYELWKDYPSQRHYDCISFMYDQDLMITCPYVPSGDTLMASWLAKPLDGPCMPERGTQIERGYFKFEEPPALHLAQAFLMNFIIYANPATPVLSPDTAAGIFMQTWFEIKLDRIHEGYINFRYCDLGDTARKYLMNLVLKTFNDEPLTLWKVKATKQNK